jgi:hypothetical protein
MSEDKVEEIVNEPINEDEQIEKPKKPRSEGQIRATEAMLKKRMENAKLSKLMKETKQKEEQEIKDKINAKLSKKIIDKAIRLENKRISRNKIAEQLLNDLDNESVSSSDTEIEKPKPKEKPIKTKEEKKIQQIKEVENITVVFDNPLHKKYNFM